jgi:hypothetical protein
VLAKHEHACVQATPTQGEYSTIAGIDNTGKGLPAGFSNKPLSASQLAAIQAASVKRTHSDAATVATPNAVTSDGGSQQVLLLSCGHNSTLQPCKSKPAIQKPALLQQYLNCNASICVPTEFWN